MYNKKFSPEKLFEYSERFYERANDWPTVRLAAHRFNVPQSSIQDACEDFCGAGYMGLVAGVISPGGTHEYEKLGDCWVEAYK